MALIFLADDDEAVRSFIKLVLEDRGDTCLEFSSGEAVLAALAQREDAALVIADMGMPQGGGRGLLASLRQGTDWQRTLPVLLISGMTPEDADLPEDRFCRFLQKPFKMARLYEVVDAMTGQGGAS